MTLQFNEYYNYKMIGKRLLISWTLEIGPYPGVLLGMRDYANAEPETEEGLVFSVVDRTFYVPFFMFIVSFYYVQSTKHQNK